MYQLWHEYCINYLIKLGETASEMINRLEDELIAIVMETGTKRSQKRVPKRSAKILQRMRDDFARRVAKKGCDPNTPLGRHPNILDKEDERGLPSGCQGDAKGPSYKYIKIVLFFFTIFAQILVKFFGETFGQFFFVQIYLKNVIFLIFGPFLAKFQLPS